MFHELNKDIEKELEGITFFSATSVMFMPQDHTGENIANAVTEILRDWNLNSECLSCITTNSAAKMGLGFPNFRLAAFILLWT